MDNLQKVLADYTAWMSELRRGVRSDLRRANLRRANLIGANLRLANLSGAKLCDAKLCNADLFSANLSGADLSGADLSGAKLCDAELYGANLSGTNLYGANLNGANLYGANLSWRTPLHADGARHYVLYVLPETARGPRFVAGCRNFTAAEALAHWGPDSPHAQPAYVAAVERYLQRRAT